MPMYSFRCPECGKRFDELLPISKKDEAFCPDCQTKAQRVWNGKCAFGAKASTSGCQGNCSGCAGCGK